MIGHFLRDLWGGLRGAVAYGVVTSVDDTGGAQTANVTTGTGVNRANVEVAQAFGFSSVPPADGAVGVLFEIGGDPGNLLVMPLGNPSTRFGNLAPGEAVMYAADGTRVHLRQGGAVEIWGGTSVTVNTKTCTINAPNGCAINGNVTITGNLTTTGDVADSHGTLDRLRGHYNGHTHPGGGTTSEPDPE